MTPLFSCEASVSSHNLKNWQIDWLRHSYLFSILLLLTDLWWKKLVSQNVPYFYQRVQNWFPKQIISPTSRPLTKRTSCTTSWFSKQEIELSKQEMELFLLLPGLWSKNFSYNNFSISTKEFKICFQNRKSNYPNRKWNHFSHFQASDWTSKKFVHSCVS